MFGQEVKDPNLFDSPNSQLKTLDSMWIRSREANPQIVPGLKISKFDKIHPRTPTVWYQQIAFFQKEVYKYTFSKPPSLGYPCFLVFEGVCHTDLEPCPISRNWSLSKKSIGGLSLHSPDDKQKIAGVDRPWRVVIITCSHVWKNLRIIKETPFFAPVFSKPVVWGHSIG